MLKPSALAALLVAGSLISAPALAEKLVVNGQTIPQSVFDAFAAEQKAQGAADSPELQKAIREELVRREVLSQEAKKKGIDKKPEVAGQIELARQAVLIRAFLADYVKSHPVSEDKLKKDYETIKGNLGSTEFKARHTPRE